MYGVLDKFTIKFETLTIYHPQNAVMFLKEWFMNNDEQRKDKIWAYAWGRYKSSLGKYCVRMASNHTAALCGGEFGGHH